MPVESDLPREPLAAPAHDLRTGRIVLTVVCILIAAVAPGLLAWMLASAWLVGLALVFGWLTVRFVRWFYVR